MITTLTWPECLRRINAMDPHYGMDIRDEEFIFGLLRERVYHPTVVELGVCHGRASAMLAYLAQGTGGAYHGVDDWRLEGSMQEVSDRLETIGLPHTLHHSDTRTLPWDDPIDVLLIDAGHDEQNVSADCAKWIPWVVAGGYVVFDDWPPSVVRSDDNPHWAVAVYGEAATTGWQSWRGPGRVMVKRKPS